MSLRGGSVGSIRQILHAYIQEDDLNVDTAASFCGTSYSDLLDGVCFDIAGRKIGTLMLNGKEAGVDAHQPLPAGQYEPETLPGHDAALRGLTDNDPGAAEAMIALHRQRPGDPLTAFYADRLGKGITGSRFVFEQK
ncbi:MAG: hypothetical protein JSW21_02865 [Gammaproteobacteria bacterium]|nr:MAG: hypothetical protein JSW21_02865 [Gammaproteobacteria bacterium]